MANVKISELPQTTILSSTDLVASVSASTTTKITVKNLADSLTQVSSSILAATASYVNKLNQKVDITGSLNVTGSYTQGDNARVAGKFSHAEGDSTLASGDASHAEGGNSHASGYGSHAEGASSLASGQYAHSEGQFSIASGDLSHAEGHSTRASGLSSHTEGYFTTASGNYSHAEGLGTVASAAYQHVQGTYNISSSNPGAFIIGNGTAANNRKNLVYASGSAVEISGSILISGSIIPAVTPGTYTSSFSLGSPTNAWKDIYVSDGTIFFTDPGTGQTSTLSVRSGSVVSSGSGQVNSGSTYVHKSAVGTLYMDTRDMYDPTGEFGSQKNLPEGYQTYYLYVGHQNCTGFSPNQVCSSSVYLYSVAQAGAGIKNPKSVLTTSQIRICNMGGYPTMSIKPSLADASEIVQIQYGSAASTYNYIDVLEGEYIDIIPSAPSGRISNALNWVVINKGTMYGW